MSMRYIKPTINAEIPVVEISYSIGNKLKIAYEFILTKSHVFKNTSLMFVVEHHESGN